jgi:hypothetical protein
LAGDVPTTPGDTSDATGASAGNGERTSETCLIELHLLTLTPYSDASLDRDIMEDPMLVELMTSLASSRFIMCPPLGTQLRWSPARG